jgi:DNA-binding transcriptional MerR regulator
MRDLTSKQEQIIERLKAIKKDLKNLYLPTEHLDELMQALQTNLESLKERPEAELFRLQAQALEQLRGALRVFRHASASFQPSLPRDRQVRGRVLDEPATPALPGYEEATKGYYLRLAGQ